MIARIFTGAFRFDAPARAMASTRRAVPGALGGQAAFIMREFTKCKYARMGETCFSTGTAGKAGHAEAAAVPDATQAVFALTLWRHSDWLLGRAAAANGPQVHRNEFVRLRR